jgi:DNA polymerase III subunit beta
MSGSIQIREMARLGGGAVKFTVEREALGEAVAWVARALPARPVIPVLSGLLIEAAGAGLTLSCFDYEVSARVVIPGDVAEPGTALVPGRLLAEITRSLPQRDVEVSSLADMVSLRCGSAEFELVSLPVEEYPGLPEPPPPAGTVDGGVLAAAAAQVVPSASRDDTLPMLTGVCVDIDGTQMTLAATDRYRLAVRTVDWSPAIPGLRAAALVPARTLADVARTMDAGIPVTIAFTTAPDAAPGAGEPHPAAGMISFEGGGRRLTARLIGGDFIRYRSRFPAEFACQAELPAELFMAAVRRVSLVADRASPVRLTFGGGEVAIEAHTDGRARAAETVRAAFAGPESVISFNPHYLLDGIAAAAVCGTAPAARLPAGAGRGSDGGSGEAAAPAEPGRIRLEFTSPAKPALITWAGHDPDLIGAAQPVAAAPAAAAPVPEPAEAGTDVAEPGSGTGAFVPGAADGSHVGGLAPGDDATGTPSFRYLVVPLRSATGSGPTRA